MLREIFSFATLAVVHTGFVAGIAYSRGQQEPHHSDALCWGLRPEHLQGTKYMIGMTGSVDKKGHIFWVYQDI